MTNSARHVLAVCASLAIAGVVVGPSVSSKLSAVQAPHEEIQMPGQWVPFSADFIVSHPGQPVAHGHYYRSSSGSSRRETGPTPSDIRVVDIHSVEDRAQYVMGARGWKRFEGSGSIEGTPLRWFEGRAGTESYPFKLALRAGQSGKLDSPEGYAAYLQNSSTGQSHLRVPSLNMFAVVTSSIDGRYEAYSNIREGEPPAELFRLPAGVTPTPQNRRMDHNGH